MLKERGDLNQDLAQIYRLSWSVLATYLGIIEKIVDEPGHPLGPGVDAPQMVVDPVHIALAHVAVQDPSEACDRT